MPSTQCPDIISDPVVQSKNLERFLEEKDLFTEAMEYVEKSILEMEELPFD